MRRQGRAKRTESRVGSQSSKGSVGGVGGRNDGVVLLFLVLLDDRLGQVRRHLGTRERRVREMRGRRVLRSSVGRIMSSKGSARCGSPPRRPTRFFFFPFPLVRADGFDPRITASTRCRHTLQCIASRHSAAAASGGSQTRRRRPEEKNPNRMKKKLKERSG